MSAHQVQRVVDSVTSGLGAGRISSVAGCPGGPVLVGLAPGEEPLARRLIARFGRDVALTVGLTTYAGHPGRSPRCGSLERSAPLPSGVRLGLDLDSRSVHSGSTFTGHVIVSDQGPDSFSMDTGQPLQAVVVRAGSRQVVGVTSDGIAGVGSGPRLAPGASSTIPVVGGTARCDGGIGSALPPGTYQVIVRVAPETSPHTPAYLTPATTVHVTGS